MAPQTIWYIQVAALVIGHVAGLVLAHDKAVELFDLRAMRRSASTPCSR